MSSSSEVQDHLNALIYNQRHFTARGLRQLHESSGIEEFTWALVISLLTSFYLVAGESAHFVANSILTFVPLLLTYIYPDEKPSNQQLLVYWGAFALLTLLDPSYHHVKGYYFGKVLLLSLLFLRPFNGADWILQQIHQASKEHYSDEISKDQLTQRAIFTKDEMREMERQSIGKTSPPPEPPESGFPREPSKERAEPSATRSALKTVATNRSKSTKLPVSKDTTHGGHNEISSAAGLYGSNESSTYKMAATSSSNTSLIGSVTANDLCFEPSHHLVFNGPFSDGNLTYKMRLRNICPRTIAFAAKSNAIQRLSADPPSGVLKPNEKTDLAITIKRFEYDEKKMAKDRIKFEYVYCPSETKKFSHKLLQQSGTGDLRRQKNIYIRYNP